MIHIQGKVVYEDLEMGFWGIVDKQGNKWRPVSMPDQLKVAGAQVQVTASEVDEDSIFMWGTPIRIMSFHTIPIFD